MHLFEAVKQSVTTRQAAERYGLNVNRNGMAVCPFHRDRHPSMKVDRRYYCFGCGATGDVIDFVSLLHGISAKEAALMLARDFSILCGDGTDAPRQSAVKKLRLEAEEQKYRRMEQHCFQVLADYYHLLRRRRGCTSRGRVRSPLRGPFPRNRRPRDCPRRGCRGARPAAR